MRRPARKPYKKSVKSDQPKDRKPTLKKRYQDRDVREMINSSNSLENFELFYEDLPSKKKLPGARLVRT